MAFTPDAPAEPVAPAHRGFIPDVPTSGGLPPMPPEHYPHETVDSIPAGGEGFTPMDNRAAAGPAAVGGYLKDWGGRVLDSFTGPNPHEGEDLGTGILSTIASPLDAALTVATGTIAPLTGWAHALDMRANEDPNYSVTQGMNDRTWAPRTDVGAHFVDQLGAVLKPLGDLFGAGGQVLGEDVGRAGGSPQLQQDVAEGALPALASALGIKAGAGALATRPSESAIGIGAGGETAARMRSYGLPVTPGSAAVMKQAELPEGQIGSVPGGIVETMANKPELYIKMAGEVAKKQAADMVGDLRLPQGTPLTEEMLRAHAKTLNAHYDAAAEALPQVNYKTPEVQDALGKIGENRRGNANLTPIPAVEALRAKLQGITGESTPKVLKAIRQFREDARKKFQQADGDKIANQDEAQAYRDAADALETGIETQLPKGSGLYEAFKAARIDQAKTHNMLDAWDGAHVDPQAILRMKQSGTKMTGALARVADAATHMPHIVKSPTGKTATGLTNTGMLTEFGSAVRRATLDKLTIPYLMSKGYQNKFGLEQPTVTQPTIAPGEIPVGPMAPSPRPPTPGVGGVDFEPTPGVPPLQPGLSIGPGESIGGMGFSTDPFATANPWPKVPEPGQPPTIPEYMGFAPENAHELPSGLGDLLSQAPPPVVDLVQTLLGNPDILAPLAEALGLGEGPPGPLNPPRGPRSLKNQRAELNTPTGVAGPEEFP